MTLRYYKSWKTAHSSEVEKKYCFLSSFLFKTITGPCRTSSYAFTVWWAVNPYNKNWHFSLYFKNYFSQNRRVNLRNRNIHSKEFQNILPKDINLSLVKGQNFSLTGGISSELITIYLKIAKRINFKCSHDKKIRMWETHVN